MFFFLQMRLSLSSIVLHLRFMQKVHTMTHTVGDIVNSCWARKCEEVFNSHQIFYLLAMTTIKKMFLFFFQENLLM